MLQTDLQYSVKDPEFTTQLQELARYFCSIENEHIRQYTVNLVREISKITDFERVQDYYEDLLSTTSSR